jgi:hypothetical protein
MSRSFEDRMQWAEDWWIYGMPERAERGYDALAPLLIKVHDGRELTREDRTLAADLLHDLGWMGWLTRSVARTHFNAQEAIEQEVSNEHP